MKPCDPAARDAALEALADMAQRTRAALGKFAPGTSQHTLQQNRLSALNVASSLLSGASPAPSREALAQAAAPLASLRSKSEKARAKLPPDTWQHRMLARNLLALDMALSLLEEAPTP